jgi:hypothetical protein
LNSQNATSTNPIFDLNYVFEPRWGDARFDKGDVLQLSDLEDKVRVHVFFADSNEVLLGRAPASPTDEFDPKDFDADATIRTISPEIRQQLMNLASATKEDQDRAETLYHAKLTVIDFQTFGADNEGVSRRHAALQWDARYITLTDLSSTNGTRINGSLRFPMQRRIVRNGDELQFGNLRLLVRYRRPGAE